jgi:hypothetical protein
MHKNLYKAELGYSMLSIVTDEKYSGSLNIICLTKVLLVKLFLHIYLP